MEICNHLPVLPPSATGFRPNCRTPVLGRVDRIQFLQCPMESISKRSNLARASVEEAASPNRMFILGMGFTGSFFAQDLLKDGWVVSGTCKSEAKRKELQERGLDALVFDAKEPELSILGQVRNYTHLLVSVPPVPGTGDLMLQNEHLLRTTLKHGSLEWLCYLSSTSVYGDCGGAWVDEDSPPNPSNLKAKLRLDAEKGWLNLGKYLGVQTVIFRLGGIYGPGRSAIDTIISGKDLSDTQKMRLSKGFTSRVHVEDISQALKASICMRSSRKFYNIVDDDPAPREEVFDYASYLVENKWPGRFRDDTYTKRPEQGLGEAGPRGEKRVSNTRLKTELGARLIHPSYRSGLQSIIKQMSIKLL